MTWEVMFVCDYCGVEVEAKPANIEAYPIGWYVLGFRITGELGDGSWIITHHYCSEECMNNAVVVKSKQQ